MVPPFQSGLSEDLLKWLGMTTTHPGSSRVSEPDKHSGQSVLSRSSFPTQSYSIHADLHDWTRAVPNQGGEPLFYRYVFDGVLKSIVEDEFNFLQHVSYSAVAKHVRRSAYERFKLTTTLVTQLEECYSETYRVVELSSAQVAPTHVQQPWHFPCRSR